MTFSQKAATMTNEIAYKAGFYDAYFMGKPDTTFDYIRDEQFFHYMQGYYSGLEQFAKDNQEAA
jgi:hypothetical protein